MRGFTLIEALVAVAILALAVAGPLYAANRALVAAGIARDRLTASYLAQEGIEYVRMMRDNEYLATRATRTAWDNFLAQDSIGKCVTSTIGVAPFCTLDPWDNSILGCSGGRTTCSPLRIIPQNQVDRYKQDLTGGTATIFTRTIQAKVITDTDEQIVSKVSWQNHGTTYDVSIIDHLTPWQ